MERRNEAGRLTKSHARMSTDRSKFKDHTVLIHEVDQRDRPSSTRSFEIPLGSLNVLIPPLPKSATKSGFSESRTVSQDPENI